MDPHILNVYECLDLPLHRVPYLIRDAVEGRLYPASEKLDGQNFTFTVREDGDVRFMGKGISKAHASRGGLSRDDIETRYSGRPNVRDAFLGAFDVLQSYSRDDGFLRDVCSDGSCISAEVITPINPNVVSYDGNFVCLISMVPPVGPSVPFMGQPMRYASGGWVVRDIPVLSRKDMVKSTRDVGTIATFVERLQKIINGCKSPGMMMAFGSMGDLLVEYVKNSLSSVVGLGGLGDEILTRAAQRLVYDDTVFIHSKEFPTSAWKCFKAIDDERAWFVGDAIADIELFFQALGDSIIGFYEFQLSSVENDVHTSSVRSFISRARAGVRSMSIRGSDIQKRRLISSLKRVDEAAFTRNVEGIVFEFDGRMMKFAGTFTGVNRVLGLFTYGDKLEFV